MLDGAGSRLPTPVFLLTGICALSSVIVSVFSICLQLKNYRKPLLQRMCVRIMLMVPIYAISSLVSLFSLEAAFFIDAVRDIYEAFVIYCFFSLLLSYLGGERSLLILLHGRPPKVPPFPVSLFKHELDVSDPYMFLFLKRGILQYVQVKPILALVTMILKATGTYNEGDLGAKSGYLYVSLVYNFSICLSLYCLALFWICVNDDLKPFRPIPKFLCVKGILFFSFWQSILISILVAAGVITHFGPYADKELLALGITDALVCIEMPFFAIAHLYAFPPSDFLDRHHSYVARMPFYYALKDSFGLKDVVEDSKATVRGEGINYREFEPSEGLVHVGEARDRRIQAGLRYLHGGKQKYWLPEPSSRPGRLERGVNRVVDTVTGDQDVHAPLLANQADDTLHLAPDLQPDQESNIWVARETYNGFELPFGDLDEGDEELFALSRQYLFGDYNYPVLDVSSEVARLTIWDEEERILRNERGAWFSPLRGSKGQNPAVQTYFSWQGYGAIGTTASRTPEDESPAKTPPPVPVNRSGSVYRSSSVINPPTSAASSSDQRSHRPLPRPASRSHSRGLESPTVIQTDDAVDLIVEDNRPVEEERERRHGGDIPSKASALRRVYKQASREAVAHSEQDHVVRYVDSADTQELQASTEIDTPSIPVYKYNDLDSDNPWA